MLPAVAMTNWRGARRRSHDCVPRRPGQRHLAEQLAAVLDIGIVKPVPEYPRMRVAAFCAPAHENDPGHRWLRQVLETLVPAHDPSHAPSRSRTPPMLSSALRWSRTRTRSRCGSLTSSMPLDASGCSSTRQSALRRAKPGRTRRHQRHSRRRLDPPRHPPRLNHATARRPRADRPADRLAVPAPLAGRRRARRRALGLPRRLGIAGAARAHQRPEHDAMTNTDGGLRTAASTARDGCRSGPQPPKRDPHIGTAETCRRVADPRTRCTEQRSSNQPR